MTGEQFRLLNIGDPVCWNADIGDQGTVTEKNWAGITVRWDGRSEQSILHNDMAQVVSALVTGCLSNAALTSCRPFHFFRKKPDLRRAFRKSYRVFCLPATGPEAKSDAGAAIVITRTGAVIARIAIAIAGFHVCTARSISIRIVVVPSLNVASPTGPITPAIFSAHQSDVF
jgi:hypothetical protein